MNFIIVYHEDVIRLDMPELTTTIKQRIKIAIEQKLVTHPELFGRPLRRSLKGHRKLRVGDYRVVYRIQGNKVKILCIQHRAIVYESAYKRL